jgi:hypothetical protein
MSLATQQREENFTDIEKNESIAGLGRKMFSFKHITVKISNRHAYTYKRNR